MSHVIFEDITRAQFQRLPRTEPPLEFIAGRVISRRDDPVLYEDLSLDQFLSLPEAKPALEYIDGKVVQKVSPKRTHSILQMLLGSRIVEFVLPRSLGFVYTELRCTFSGRSLVPDLCFIAQGRIPRGEGGDLAEDIRLAPDLMIEIISPGQTIKDLSARLRWCVEQGVRLGWLIQPTKRRVYVFRPDHPESMLELGDSLSGEDVLPGFNLPLNELFGWSTLG